MSTSFKDLQDLLSLAAAYELGDIQRTAFWESALGLGFNRSEIAAARKMQRIAMDNDAEVKAC